MARTNPRPATDIKIGDHIAILGGPNGAVSPHRWTRFARGFSVEVSYIRRDDLGTHIGGTQLTTKGRPVKALTYREAVVYGPEGGQWATCVPLP